MKMQMSDLGRGMSGAAVLALATGMVMAIAGCQQSLKPGETSHKVAVAFPLFDSEKWTGVDEKGLRYEKEKGDAVCFLIGWEKTRKFTKDDESVCRKNRSTFIPFYTTETEETQQYVKTSSLVLLFPSSSYKTKVDACPPPPACPPKK